MPDFLSTDQPWQLLPGLLTGIALVCVWWRKREQRAFLCWGLSCELAVLYALGVHVTGGIGALGGIRLHLVSLAGVGSLALLLGGALAYTGRPRALLASVCVFGALGVCAAVVAVALPSAVPISHAALDATVSLLAAALLYSRGGLERVAALVLASRAANAWFPNPLLPDYPLESVQRVGQLLVFAAGLCLLAAVLARSVRALESGNRVLQLYYDLMERLDAVVERDRVFDAAGTALVEGNGIDSAAIFLHRPERHEYERVCTVGLLARDRAGVQRFADDAPSLTRSVHEQGRALAIRDLRTESDLMLPAARMSLLASGMRSALGAPIRYRGRNYGSYILSGRRAHERAPQELAAYEALGEAIGLALNNLEHERELQEGALHDALTGLPNRAALAQQLELSGEATLVLIDLDRFKEVNDTLGHDIGDRLLRHVGSVLRELGAEVNARVFRLGGDDFALLLAGDSRGTHAERLANRALARLAQPAELGGVSLAVDATIGIAVTDAGEADLRELLRRAEVAMYHGKASAAVVTRYRAQLDPHTRERLQLITELRSALAAGQLHLHYQPKVRLSDGALHGVEALLRWQHPQLGWIAPDRFVPMAELSPLINGITLWVAETAIAQIREWRGRGLALTVAINVSVRNLVQPGWCEELIERVRRAAIDPGALELEITETVLMQDAELSRERLGVLVNAGLRIAIDDFGTGYSSLAYLQQLPIHTLKIDRAFVMQLDRDAQSARIVETIMSLAGALKLATVAEGIEDTDSAHYLTQLGCELGQGYLYSKPLAIAALEGWMAVRREALA